ncbi:MAG: D-alanyl-D-alanine carboxypeptidase [Acidiferrobacterales bacterium]|nr:D-alanyl-D-alanine carboxypeptidase [Acidiferrobacterales bacterium]
MINLRLLVLLLFLFCVSSCNAYAQQIFANQQFKETDAILVSSAKGQELFAWQADKALIPASLMKILTSYLAIDKWGLSHRFKTDFHQLGTQLWVKGYGDPYLVSEEIDVIASKLKEMNLGKIDSIHIDASYFAAVTVPGRSKVVDPYNAPLSAVAANFNTAFVSKSANQIFSAEAQTPLTATAVKITEATPSLLKNGEKVRVNLIDSNNAQSNFAELLALKLDLQSVEININQRLPNEAKRVYQHSNSHSLQQILIGSMKYSNNFITNQVFLKLTEEPNAQSLSFNKAQSYAAQKLASNFAWQNSSVVEGAGLSRDNRMSARQINEVLAKLASNKNIFNAVTDITDAKVYAKTGTLNGVSNYAGYIDFADRQYHFVFMFNRTMPYGFRDQLLKALVEQLLEIEQS